ncbi:unnamed protein product [Polarella glacialis]|uniref:Uncharacterized protein n=1 Tax=Polarella glacialis TaxID=89957 RepID=A0A813F7S4_POLGL|nr:unnamed protein product [Polarella glacialis]
MVRHGRRSGLLSVAFAVGLISAAGTISLHSCQLFVAVASGFNKLASGPSRARGHSVPRRAEEVEVVRSIALVKVEQDIEIKLAEAEKSNDTKRITELARLLVLAKASEGAAAWQSTAELRETVGNSIAKTLSEFVGKENYDINDVAKMVDTRLTTAVSAVENVYLTREAAASAPPGSNPIVLSDVMTPVVAGIAEGVNSGVTAFTGKEKYEFGDISMEADKRAKAAIALMLGKEEYQFGDISKAAAAKTMDAVASSVTSFTGKEEYKFGDISKTLLRNALNFLEKDDDKKK